MHKTTLHLFRNKYLVILYDKHGLLNTIPITANNRRAADRAALAIMKQGEK